MKKNFLLIFLDTIFFSFCFFSVSLIFVSYLIKPPFTYLISLLLSCLFSLIIYKILSARESKKYLAKKQLAEIEALEDFLSLSRKTEVTKIFTLALKNKNLTVERKKGGLHVLENNAIFFTAFGFEGLTKTQVVKIFNLLSPNENAVILCNQCSLETKAFIERFNGKIKVYTSSSVYEFLKETNCLPELPKLEKPSKVKATIKSFFAKKRATKFFALGLTFLVLSFFVYFKTYYIVMGTFFMLLSVTARFFGIAETTVKHQKLLD